MNFGKRAKVAWSMLLRWRIVLRSGSASFGLLSADMSSILRFLLADWVEMRLFKRAILARKKDEWVQRRAMGSV